MSLLFFSFVFSIAVQVTVSTFFWPLIRQRDLLVQFKDAFAHIFKADD